MSTSTPTPVPPHDQPPVFAGDDDWEETLIPARSRTPWLTRILALAAVAALAFGGGAYAHKTWGGSGDGSAAGSGAAAARGALGGAPLGPGAGAGGGARQGQLGQGGTGQGGAGLGGLAGAQPTIGEVKYIEGDTLYVETADGATVKVRVAKSVPVAKTETTDVSGIDAGDQVAVVGDQGDDGVVVASQVSVGGLASAIGRRGGLFPGGGAAGGAGGDPSGQPDAGGGAGFEPGG